MDSPEEPLFATHWGVKGSAGDVTKPFPVPSLPRVTSKPRRLPLRLKNIFAEVSTESVLWY